MWSQTLAWLFRESNLQFVAGLGLLGGLLSAAVWHDMRSFRIPNVIVYSGTAVAIFLNAFLPEGHGLLSADHGGIGLWKSLEGLAVGLAALLPVYLIRAAGAGDAKLMAMVGAFLGPVDTFGAVLLTYFAGAILAIVFALRAGVLRQAARNVRTILWSGYARMSAADGPTFDAHTQAAANVPYALAVTAGTLVWVVLKQVA